MNLRRFVSFTIIVLVASIANQSYSEGVSLQDSNGVVTKLKITKKELFKQRDLSVQKGKSGDFEDGTLRVILQALSPLEAMDSEILRSTAEEICEQIDSFMPVAVFFHDALTTDKRGGAATACYVREADSSVKEIYDYSRPRIKDENPLPADIPPYEVLDEVVLFDKSRDASILVPSLSPRSEPKEVERVLRAIFKKEGFASGNAYSTREARIADGSASYSKANPEAYKSGYLGSIIKGQFYPATPRK